jgi:hypothetical protein
MCTYQMSTKSDPIGIDSEMLTFLYYKQCNRLMIINNISQYSGNIGNID